MLLTWAAVLAFLGFLFDPAAIHRAALTVTREIAKDPVILEGLWEMLGRAQFGFSSLEEAAFVVAAPDGTLSLRRWPATGELNESHWKGAIPADAIAIVHTHPNKFPQPSRLDAQTAVETGLPVYVLTRSTIMKTNAGHTEVVANRPWSPGKHSFPALVQRRARPAATTATTARAIREGVVREGAAREGSALLLGEDRMQGEHHRE